MKKFSGEKCLLHLYFAGRNPRTTLAISNLRKLCADRLPQKCKVKLIDISRNPALAKRDQIVAVPMLVKKFPLPERKIIGNLSDLNRVLLWLDLK